MTIGRRRFMLGAALTAAWPVLASLVSRPTLASSPALPSSDPTHPHPLPAATDPVFRIQGWDAEDVTDDAPWITVDRSWRTAWH